jgi:Flp pilus assembly protein TadG
MATTSRRKDDGAAAVELALVLPILLLLVFGIVDFGRALNLQITLTQAAREGVRPAALRESTTAVNAAVAAATVGVTGPAPTVAISACPPGAGTATVTVSKTFQFVTPVGAIADLISPSSIGGNIPMTGQGAMRCSS